jgi:cell division protein FtsB
MSKVRIQRQRVRRPAEQQLRWRKEPRKNILPSWIPIAAASTLVLLLVLTVNYRAYSELRRQSQEFQDLNDRVQQATTENLSMQEEIYYLRSDPHTVEQEARKYGLARPKEQVSRAGDTDKAEQSAKPATPTRK